jgi:hypothetical protein
MLKMCPECGDPSQLATIERVLGFAGAVMTVDDDGELDLEYTGGTDMVWDDSQTIGVICTACRWYYEGADWQSKLPNAPSLLAVVQAVVDDILARTSNGAVATDTAGPDETDDVRVRGAVLANPAGPDTPLPHVRLLVEILGDDYVFPGDLDRLYIDVRDSLPTVETALQG